ncbi:hypothetical protein AA0498_1211 [Acidomonas methanolica]|uniref:Uncharacterized protein n=1 Tax=Acidomonas methanolica NBRC 104435 TaxID=1231351 RepID=A0A023D885_ACIMT|nr:hypothetical protein Amme_129_006 [Acidomonas methanolica NBRC 104435]GBQ50448.1 hypothetical protein AA0498_1211 [Acidomonas methanolica]GEL00489.1 hypothetical protein AME01nite_29870 [Acidomonas methanolica NBRC 104435]
MPFGSEEPLSLTPFHVQVFVPTAGVNVSVFTIVPDASLTAIATGAVLDAV